MAPSLDKDRYRRVVVVAGIALLAVGVGILAVKHFKNRQRYHTQTVRRPISQASQLQVFQEENEERRQALQAAAKGKWAPAWSLLDHVSLYQKNGLVEHYGANFRERRSRPIRIDRTLLHVTDPRAWLMWWPDRTPRVADSTILEVAFAEASPTQGSLIVGLLMRSGDVFLFGHHFSDPAAMPAAGQPSHIPEEFLAMLAKAPPPVALLRQENRLQALLPEGLLAQLRNDDQSVRSWFVGVTGQAGSDVAFDHISLMRPASPTSARQVTLAGAIHGKNSSDPLTVELVLESGERFRHEENLEGTFSFAGVPMDMPVSLCVEHDKQDHFATLGRWFVPGGDQHDLVIDMTPVFSNPDKKKPDPKERFAHMDGDSQLSGLYASHARQLWNGFEGDPQEYKGLSFSNNIGHLDRDRFVDNPDKCYRIVHLGSSHAVACQLRPGDKYNILMEAELGVRLGRPVEVISLGRNNGDVAANYPRVRDLARKFNPDVILLEHGSFLMMQLHPELLRRMHGYDAAHTHLDNFYYANGTLVFRPWCRDWPLYVQKADKSELTSGVPFYDTLRVPFEHMHALGRENFQYLADIMIYYKKQFPGQNVLLHTGLDQAQQRVPRRTTKLADGSSIPIGADVFMQNMATFCREHEILCLQPAMPQGFNDKPETYLTFLKDGHFSPRGHQWLAKELSAKLIQTLGLTSQRPGSEGEASEPVSPSPK